MKTYIRYLVAIAFSLFLLVSVSAQSQGSVSLIMVPILAAVTSGIEPPEEVASPGPPTVMWLDRNARQREWQRNDNGRRYAWSEAVDYCEALGLDGHTDWVLPTIEELKDIVVCSNGTSTPMPDCFAAGCTCGDEPDSPRYGFDSPVIDDSFVCRQEYYWTESPNGPTSAHYINFYRGGASTSNRTEKYFVRCIRI